MVSNKLLIVCTVATILCASVQGKGGRGGGGHGGGSRGGGSHGWGRSSGGHTYPHSGGYSGTGRGNAYGGGGSHTYPHSNGMSGNSKPTYGGTSHPSYRGGGYGGGAHHVPSYYQAPQQVYIHEYRQSGSSYSNLLTGLALYNMGRSSHQHHYYYHDQYSRSRYPDSYSESQPKSEDEATCTLRVEQRGEVSRLRVPCEIVSTFAAAPEVDQKITVANVTVANCTTSDGVQVEPSFDALSGGVLVNATLESGRLVSGRVENATLLDGTRVDCSAVGSMPAPVDPMAVKGTPVGLANDARCSVEIRTKNLLTARPVDCGELERYSKMEMPPEQAGVPSAENYRSWLNNPPWWLSVFFVV